MHRMRVHCTLVRFTPRVTSRAVGRGLWIRQCLVTAGAIFSLGWGASGLPCLAQETDQAQDKPAAKATDSNEASTQEKQDWKPLLDGKSLDGWKITDVGGQGEVSVHDGIVSLGMGAPLPAITNTGEFPNCDYALQMEARRVDGVDFFSTVTFPVGDSFCSLVVGGWGGSVVGISCINGSDASENETTKYVRFTKGQWYRIRISVRRDRIQAWIDDKPVVDLETAHRKLSTRVEVYLCQPLGVASWVTRSELRNIQYRVLEAERPSDVHKSPAEGAGAESKQPAEESKKSEAGAFDA